METFEPGKAVGLCAPCGFAGSALHLSMGGCYLYQLGLQERLTADKSLSDGRDNRVKAWGYPKERSHVR